SKLSLKFAEENIFSRCLLCNELLKQLPKEEAEGKVPDFIFRLYDAFHSCPRCQRIYWPGTHWEKMKKEVAQIFGKDGKIL
ncbi:MAG: Mut7-C RNAse domain-containing protein, partial [bacterium]